MALALSQSAQPDDPVVNDALGCVYYRQGGYLSAIPAFEKAAGKNPQVAEFQFHLGMAYLSAGQPAAAHNTLQTALRLGLRPDDARTAQTALQKTGSY